MNMNQSNINNTNNNSPQDHNLYSAADKTITLTQKQLDEIADLAAERAIEKVYLQVGKSVIRKALWILGAAALALFLGGNHFFIGKQ